MISVKLRNRLIRSAIVLAAEAVVRRKPNKSLISVPKRTARGAEAVRSTIGANLRAARLTAELTQSELAEKAKTTTRTISAIERGNHDTKLILLAEIARALGKRVADLAAGT